jgi:hypothetical protein
MRTVVLTVVTAAFLVLPCSGAIASDLTEGVKLEAGDEVIDVPVGHLVPCVVDWNQDRKKDLIVGQFSGGKVRLYLNKGTDRKPKLGDFVYMEAGGKEISLPAG